MGSVYPRNGKLWVAFKRGDGKRKARNSGFVVGQEALAQRLLEEIERQIKEGTTVDLGPPTVDAFARRWIELMKGEIEDWLGYERHLRLHILPVIGDKLLHEVRRRDVLAVVTKAKKARKAPRTVRNIYGVVQSMYQAALREELIDRNPCTLTTRPGELPEVVDKDPEWRSNAIYTRGELGMLISDPRIPPNRRLLYALMGLARCRLGEAAGLRWRHYDPSQQPLGRLIIAMSYDKKRTKTNNTRWMPVHPTLAGILAEWKLKGWPALMGRPPGPEDLIALRAPTLKTAHPSAWDKGRARDAREIDLKTLGLRYRRGHDLNRTMISLAITDGASKDLLKYCTHGPPKAEAIDAYITLGWEVFCREVVKLKIERREVAQVVQLRAEAGGAATAVATQEKSPSDSLGFRMTPPGIEPGIPA